MKTIMERRGNVVTDADGMTSTIPSDVSMLSIFARNPFFNEGDYREDGFIYVDGKPVKKWFKKIEDVTIWFPILDGARKLQDRFYKVKQVYTDYLKNEYAEVCKQLLKVKKAHAYVTHEFDGTYAPWWLYKVSKWGDHEGISFDWVDTPKNPINLDIGNAYYKADQRLMQIGARVHKFRSILHYAIKAEAYKIKGESGDILQLKVGDKTYWFEFGRFAWEKMVFPEDNLKTVEI